MPKRAPLPKGGLNHFPGEQGSSIFYPLVYFFLPSFSLSSPSFAPTSLAVPFSNILDIIPEPRGWLLTRAVQRPAWTKTPWRECSVLGARLRQEDKEWIQVGRIRKAVCLHAYWRSFYPCAACLLLGASGGSS